MTGQELVVFYTENGFTVDTEKTADKSAYDSESLRSVRTRTGRFMPLGFTRPTRPCRRRSPFCMPLAGRLSPP